MQRVSNSVAGGPPPVVPYHAFADQTSDPNSDVLRSNSGGVRQISAQEFNLQSRQWNSAIPSVPQWGKATSPARRELQQQTPDKDSHLSLETLKSRPSESTPLKQNITTPTGYLIPLPARPDVLSLNREASCQVPDKDSGSARAWPHTTEPPLVAPRLLDDKRADFWPWKGNHPEDRLSVESIKQGFSDKQHMQAEYQMARPSIWPTLKKGRGLQMLSTLYAAVLEEREAQGRITAPSTFKPPPRVTLTDYKRDAWLRDLTNANIPLRRLSRTIPHGIRGKSLLDQCLTRKIPIDRAVWLSKCVGANEIRAFRRKGAGSALSVGGETKWIREWTIQVEQWIDSVIAKCGEVSWKEDINYSLILCSHIFSEGLLDQDTFLDWIVSAFDTSSLDTVPVWGLIIQMFWAHLVGGRKTGSKLAISALRKLNQIANSADPSIFDPLTKQLKNLIKDEILSTKDNFVSPTLWREYGSTLRELVHKTYPPATPIVEEISKRCSKLLPKSDDRDMAEKALIRILDSSYGSCQGNDIWTKCKAVPEVKPILVPTIFKWATSKYREGTFRIFLGARLLRKAKQIGLDIEAPILELLLEGSADGLHTPSAFHLISDLMRSRTFAPSKYLQWLIARGALNGHNNIEEETSPGIQLLLEMPLRGLSGRVLNLRSSLLENLQYSTVQEKSNINRLIASVDSLLLEISSAEDLDDHTQQQTLEFINTLSSCSWTVKSEVGWWLNSWISSHSQDDERSFSTDDSKDRMAIEPCNLVQFQVVATILNSTKDLGILADVFGTMSTTSQPRILASIAELLRDQRQSFESIGAFEDCLDGVLDQYKILKSQSSPNETAAFSLIDACSSLDEYKMAVKELRSDLIECRKASAAAACSPVSDHMMETNDSDESNFSDEIERVLASGNTIDRPTLKRLFGAITHQMQDIWDTDYNKLYHYGQLLTKLGQLEYGFFSELMRQWLSQILIMSERPTLSILVPPLCASRCLELSLVLDCYAAQRQKIGPNKAVGTLSVEVLEMFSTATETKFGILDLARYTYRSQRSEALKARRSIFLSVLSDVAAESSVTGNPKVNDVVESVCADEVLVSALRESVILSPDELLKVVLQPDRDAAAENAKILCRIVNAIYDSGFPYNSAARAMSMIVERSDIFSLTYSRLQLRMMLSGRYPIPDASGSSLLASFLGVVDAVRPQQTRLFTNLILSLGPQVASKVCEHSSLALQKLLPGVKPSFSSNARLVEKLEFAELYIALIEATSSHVTETQARSQTAKVEENIMILEHVLQEMQKSQSTSISTDHLSEINAWLLVLLRLISCWRFQLPTSQKVVKDQGVSMTSLCNIFLMPILQDAHPETTSRVFDIAAVLIDDLPDDTKTQCARALRDKANDNRIKYLLSFKRSQFEEFAIVHRGRPSAFIFKPWETLSEPTANFGENDTSLSLTLFQARKF